MVLVVYENKFKDGPWLYARLMHKAIQVSITFLGIVEDVIDFLTLPRILLFDGGTDDPE